MITEQLLRQGLVDLHCKSQEKVEGGRCDMCSQEQQLAPQEIHTTIYSHTSYE